MDHSGDADVSRHVNVKTRTLSSVTQTLNLCVGSREAAGKQPGSSREAAWKQLSQLKPRDNTSGVTECVWAELLLPLVSFPLFAGGFLHRAGSFRFASAELIPALSDLAPTAGASHRGAVG